MSYQPEPIPAELSPAYVARELRRVADSIAVLARRLQELERRVQDLEASN